MKNFHVDIEDKHKNYERSHVSFSYLGLVPIGGPIREGIRSILLWVVCEKDTDVVLTKPGRSPLK